MKEEPLMDLSGERNNFVPTQNDTGPPFYPNSVRRLINLQLNLYQSKLNEKNINKDQSTGHLRFQKHQDEPT